jgi:hypothetical protein
MKRIEVPGQANGLQYPISTSSHVWWHVSVIPTMQEAAVRRITVPGQPRQKKIARPHLERKKLGMIVHAYHPSNGGKLNVVGSCPGQPG